jgi:cation transport ATPase
MAMDLSRRTFNRIRLNYVWVRMGGARPSGRAAKARGAQTGTAEAAHLTCTRTHTHASTHSQALGYNVLMIPTAAGVFYPATHMQACGDRDR